MLFNGLIFALLITNVIAIYRTAPTGWRRNLHQSGFVLLVVAAITGKWPLLDTLLETNTALIFLSAGILSSMAAFVIGWRQHGIRGYLPVTACICTVGLSLIIADNAWFRMQGHVGVAIEEQFVTKLPGCQGLILIDIDNPDGHYRCPTSTVFGSLLYSPLVPWPHYTDGNSRGLKREIDDIRASAVTFE